MTSTPKDINERNDMKLTDADADTLGLLEDWTQQELLNQRKRIDDALKLREDYQVLKEDAKGSLWSRAMARMKS